MVSSIRIENKDKVLPEITGLSAGSTQMIFRSGFLILRYRPAPVRVPPEPEPHTNMSTFPAVSFHISGPES
ncbi:hypothetical protein DsansV1_C11g0111921 [Dioscorea sansibarensis]